MLVTLVKTRNYSEKPTMDTWSKQTQSNPTCSELVEPISKGVHYCSAERCSLLRQGYGGQAGGVRNSRLSDFRWFSVDF